MLNSKIIDVKSIFSFGLRKCVVENFVVCDKERFPCSPVLPKIYFNFFVYIFSFRCLGNGHGWKNLNFPNFRIEALHEEENFVQTSDYREFLLWKFCIKNSNL